jgi:maltose alpha-D-glucosyltransferase/alpha-amylase
MGDNIWLEDRDSSRTPMQWTPDRNAGFSEADPGKLYLPVVQSLVYHYGFSNVETQLAQQASLLHWVRTMVHLRKQHPVLGVGSLRVVRTDNPSALAFIRDMHAEDCRPGERPETMLCVYSFAHHPVSISLQLPEEFRANKVTDVMGGAVISYTERARSCDDNPSCSELLLAVARRGQTIGGLGS